MPFCPLFKVYIYLFLGIKFIASDFIRGDFFIQNNKLKEVLSMRNLSFVQLQKDNEEHYNLFESLMVPYNKELCEHRPEYPVTDENVLSITKGILNMQGPHDRHLELCYDGDILIGFLYGKVDHKGHKGFIKPEYGYIMEFYVKPEYRRKGYGRAMFERFESLFAKHGTYKMYLTADPVTGEPFWKAMGFKATGDISPENSLLIFEKDVHNPREIITNKLRDESLRNNANLKFRIKCLTKELVPFVHNVFEQNREILHGVRISLDEWYNAFGKYADPYEANFIIMHVNIPIAWLKLNGLQKPEICISMLVVDKAYQHKGVGSFALQFAEEYARAKLKSAILIQTTVDNIIAKSCYVKSGYMIIREMIYKVGDGIDREGYEFKKIVNNQILTYVENALIDRFNYKGALMNEVVFNESPSYELCRIIYSCGRTLISVDEKYKKSLKQYLSTIVLYKKIRNINFYKELLIALGLNPDDFSLEPTDELVANKQYNCSHTLEYVCNKNYFVPFSSNVPIKKIHRGEDGFILDNNFDDTMYCIIENESIASMSFCRPNHEKYEGTYAMQVSTKKDYRFKGYGKSVASETTESICKKNGLALWVCQVENIGSQKIADDLGYLFIGGEIRIKY